MATLVLRPFVKYSDQRSFFLFYFFFVFIRRPCWILTMTTHNGKYCPIYVPNVVSFYSVVSEILPEEGTITVVIIIQVLVYWIDFYPSFEFHASNNRQIGKMWDKKKARWSNSNASMHKLVVVNDEYWTLCLFFF